MKKKDKNILIASESLGLYTTKRFLIEARKQKREANWFNPYDSLLFVKELHSTTMASAKASGLYLFRTSGTRYDDFDLLVARHFSDTGLKVSNPLTFLPEFRSKDMQSLFFKRHHLPAIPSVVFRGPLNENYWEEIAKLGGVKGNFVLKMVRGNQGTGVNLLSGHQSLKSILETFHALKDQRFLIQPYIDHKKEWRIFIIKNRIAGVIEKTLTGDDFRGNSKRSKGKFLKKLPKELADLALGAAALSGLEYCGIDLMETKKGPVILEINAVPGFEQMEELSGLNIAGELLTDLS